MKTLIIYASKIGSTKKCANIISENNDMSDLVEVNNFKGNINEYEKIVLCTPVYMGAFNKKIKAILTTNKDELISKSVKIVFCGMNTKELELVIKNNVDEELINNAEIIYAGGEYDFNKLSFLQKFIVKKIAKVDHSIDAIKYEALKNV